MRTGYGRACHDYFMALITGGVDLIGQAIIDGDTDDLHPRYAPIIPRIATDIHDWPEDVTHCIVHTIPKHAHVFVTGEAADPIPKGVKRINLTTWETDFLPQEIVDNHNKYFDLTVVPCAWNLEVFKRYGVENVVCIPHAFDPQYWWTDAPTHTRSPGAPYTFYNIGTWSTRKNPINLLTAYFATFGPEDNVLLKILCPDTNQDDVYQLIQAMGRDETAPVEFLGGTRNSANERSGRRLSDDEIRDLHLTSDCYVSLARGEGWGLGAFEAMLVGNMVIATGGHSHSDFLDDYWNYMPVDYNWTPIVLPEMIPSFRRFKTGEIDFVVVNALKDLTLHGRWTEPHIDSCQAWMKMAMAEQPPKRDDHRKWASDAFSYETVGRMFHRALEAM